MTSVSHGGTLPLVELPLLGPDEINRDLDVLPDQLLPQELPGFVGIMGLPRVGLSEGRDKRKISGCGDKEEEELQTLVPSSNSVVSSSPSRPCPQYSIGPRSTP